MSASIAIFNEIRKCEQFSFFFNLLPATKRFQLRSEEDTRQKLKVIIKGNTPFFFPKSNLMELHRSIEVDWVR